MKLMNKNFSFKSPRESNLNKAQQKRKMASTEAEVDVPFSKYFNFNKKQDFGTVTAAVTKCD